jgi:RHS repeat-associated protein
MSHRALSVRCPLVVAVGLTLLPLLAQAQGQGTVDPFYGSFGTEVPITVPKFRGLTPNLRLLYSSTGANGWVGVGWSVSGVSRAVRAACGGGVPRYDASDIFTLDGQELIACGATSQCGKTVSTAASPSCLTGGTHATKIESYQRIQWDAANNRFYVWAKDGTKATLSAQWWGGLGTYSWAVTSVVDPHGNTVGYGYWCDPSNDCYLDNVAYNGTVVKFYSELRSDPMTAANGQGFVTTRYRLKTIDVTVSGSRARAYQLTYTTSASTSRSLLASVQQFGRDATLDASGTVTGVTALPAMSFAWTASDLAMPYAAQSGPSGPNTFSWSACGDRIVRGDFDGDGKTDIACGYDYGGGQYALFIFPGGGNGYYAHSSGGPNSFSWSACGNRFVVGDFNGDGKSDIACGYDYGGGQYALFIFPGGGNGYYTAAGPSAPNSFSWSACGARFLVGDYSKRGLAEIACGYDYGGGQYALFVFSPAGVKPDLVRQVSNGLGGVTTVGYRPETLVLRADQRDLLHTSSSVTTTDGRGASSTTNYTYAGGLWSDAERRFLGFRKVTAVLDAAGNYTETYYHQHVGCTSKPEVTYFRDAAGNIYSYSSMSYQENAAPPYTSLLTDRWDYECNQTASCRRTLTQLGYDGYGNLITAYEHGDYDVAGDERTTVKGFYPSTAAYVVAWEGYENVYQGIGTGGALLKQTLYQYDGATSYTTAPTKGDITTTRRWLNTSTTGGYVDKSATYDGFGNLIATTDGRGCTSTTTYDGTYHLYATQTCGCLNQCSSLTWDAVLGVKTAETGLNGYTTSFAHDALGRPVQKTLPDGSRIQYSYLAWGDPNNQRTRETAADGSADGLWQETYQDGLGREWRTCAKGGYCRDTLYSDASSRGWKQSLAYGPGETPVYAVKAYDGAGRLRTVTNPDGTYAENVYGNGYVVHYDESRHEKVVWKDGLGRTSQVREKNGASYYYTTYAHNAAGDLTRVTDAVGNVATFTADSLGRKVSQCDPDAGCLSFTYDAEGAVLSRTDAKGQTLTYAYDLLGRLTGKAYLGGTKASWTYDEAGHGAGKGHPTTITYPGGSESLSYDTAGRVTQAVKCVDAVCATIKSAFDAAGRLASVAYPDNEVVTYGYNSAGQLTSASGYVTALAYNARGQMTSVGYANGVTAAYAYHGNRAWLATAQVTSAGGAVLYQASYDYGADARVTVVSSTTNPLSSLTFGYDDLHRLTSVAGGQSQTFAYNALGDMTSNSALGAYAYGDATHKHAVTAAGAKAYAYDASGNMTSGDGRTIAWDYDNHPTSVTQGGATTSFAYDAAGARVKKVTAAGTTRYYGPLVELKPDGTWVKYVAVGKLLVARNESTGKYYYHQDHLGSVRLITNAAQSVVNRYDYAAFGALAGTPTEGLGNALGYQGHRRDAETGLVYMNARYYDPTLGRFISADTVVPDPGNPQALNRYAFVYNNPISNVDPSGHVPVVAAVIAVAAVVGGGASAAIIAVAVVGAACVIAGYYTQSPLLMTIGAVCLGFAGGFVGPLLGGGLAGGLLGATVAGLTSPVSPLDPGVKQAIGWAYTAAGLIAGFTGKGSGLSQDEFDAKVAAGEIESQDYMRFTEYRETAESSFFKYTGQQHDYAMVGSYDVDKRAFMDWTRIEAAGEAPGPFGLGGGVQLIDRAPGATAALQKTFYVPVDVGFRMVDAAHTMQSTFQYGAAGVCYTVTKHIFGMAGEGLAMNTSYFLHGGALANAVYSLPWSPWIWDQMKK